MTQQARTRLTLLVLMALTVIRMPLALALQLLLPEASVSPELNYVASILQSLMMFALPGWLLTPVWRMPEGERSQGIGWFLLALAAALLARAVTTPLNAWWAGLVKAPETALPQADGPGGAVLMLLAVVVIPAVAEELFFRGALLTNLLQAGSRTQALALASAMFALMHGSLAGLPGHLIIGLLLTLLMMRSGRLAEPITAHMMYNLLALVWPEMAVFILLMAGVGLAVLLVWLIVTLPCGKTRRLPLPEGLLCAAILLAMAAQYVF